MPLTLITALLYFRAIYRLANFRKFVDSSNSTKILLRSLYLLLSMTCRLFSIFTESKICDSVQVHYIRRSWPHIQIIKKYCNDFSQLRMSVNGGVVGLGCNGIHFIELFLYLNGYQDTKCTFHVLMT